MTINTLIPLSDFIIQLDKLESPNKFKEVLEYNTLLNRRITHQKLDLGIFPNLIKVSEITEELENENYKILTRYIYESHTLRLVIKETDIWTYCMISYKNSYSLNDIKSITYIKDLIPFKLELNTRISEY